MTTFQASDAENRDKVLNDLYFFCHGKATQLSHPPNVPKDLSLDLKLVSESEYTGINAHSKKDISLIGLRKYL